MSKEDIVNKIKSKHKTHFEEKPKKFNFFKWLFGKNKKK